MAYTSEQRRAIYQRDKEKIQERNRLYYAKNREVKRAWQNQYRHDNPEKLKQINKRQNQKRKGRLLDYLGTRCCQLCGYNTCIEALDFHHINPQEKDMVLHKKDLSVVVKAELDKCLVLCSNCHREVHAGYRTIK